MKPTQRAAIDVALDTCAQALGARTPLQRTILRTLVQEILRILELDLSPPARPPPVPAARAPGARTSIVLPTQRGFPPPPPPGDWEHMPTPIDPRFPQR